MDQQLAELPMPLTPSCFLEEGQKTPSSDRDHVAEHLQRMLSAAGAGSQYQSIPKGIADAKLYVSIVEILPHIIVSDGHETIEAIFTKESINDLRRSHGSLGLSKLRDKVIHVTQWSLQVDYADSTKEYFSYKNVTIRLVIEQFRPMMQ